MRGEIDYNRMLQLLDIPEMPGVPSSMDVTNRLMLELIRQTKMAVAVQDVGIQWDTYEKWIVPGATPTKICDVNPGDLTILKIMNYDTSNAQPIYYGNSIGVRPSKQYGLQYHPRTISGTCDQLDFSEDLGVTMRTAAIAHGAYNTGAAFAAAIQVAMNAVVGIAATYSVQWLDAVKLLVPTSDGAGPSTFDLHLLTGPSGPGGAGTSIATQAGFDETADKTGALTYDSDHTLLPDLSNVQHMSIGYPLFAGDWATLVLSETSYAILDEAATLPAPLAVRRSRLVRSVGR